MSDNPLEPGVQPSDRINVLVESDLEHWANELDVSRALLARAISEVGERVEDVKRRIAELSESGD